MMESDWLRQQFQCTNESPAHFINKTLNYFSIFGALLSNFRLKVIINLSWSNHVLKQRERQDSLKCSDVYMSGSHTKLNKLCTYMEVKHTCIALGLANYTDIISSIILG